jgi:uncharacterized membrane-anchored protein
MAAYRQQRYRDFISRCYTQPDYSNYYYTRKDEEYGAMKIKLLDDSLLVVGGVLLMLPKATTAFFIPHRNIMQVGIATFILKKSIHGTIIETLRPCRET